jgi:hypothetical protein
MTGLPGGRWTIRAGSVFLFTDLQRTGNSAVM